MQSSHAEAARLPEPGPAAAAHGRRVAAAIGAAIAGAGGAIGFDRFMELALYAPGLGYYQAGLSRFGAAGDFVTAPELTPLFGRCLARQVGQVLAALPAEAEVLELGAGSGRLAADLLAALAGQDRLPARYRILETSADLAAQQRQRLADWGERVCWAQTLPAAPWAGVVVANEVADALPVMRFRRTDTGVEELTVIAAGGGLDWSARPAGPELAGAVAGLERRLGARLPAGYISEINPRLEAWLSGITERLQAGLALFIDYGYTGRDYYAAERDGGTLVAHYRHRGHHELLARPGLQDLSAFVDFSALAEAGTAAGLDLAGFATQAHFLLGCGLEDELQALAGQGQTGFLQQAQAAKRLILPGEMGERFKVLALSRGLSDPLRGFGLRDLRDRL